MCYDKRLIQFDGLGGITTAGGVTFSYDNCGNLTSKSNCEIMNYGWKAIGLHYIVTERGGTQSHSFNTARFITTTCESDWYFVLVSTTTPSLHHQFGGMVESEGHQFGAKWADVLDAGDVQGEALKMRIVEDIINPKTGIVVLGVGNDEL